MLQQNLELSMQRSTQQFGSKPNIVFYVAGVDVVKVRHVICTICNTLQGDKLGRLAVTKEGLRDRERSIVDYFFKFHKIPLVILTGGGYQATSEETAELHAYIFREAFKIYNEL
jgi:acetoin utilization deacetylase AcuC-like enzyme